MAATEFLLLRGSQLPILRSLFTNLMASFKKPASNPLQLSEIQLPTPLMPFAFLVILFQGTMINNTLSLEKDFQIKSSSASFSLWLLLFLIISEGKHVCSVHKFSLIKMFVIFHFLKLLGSIAENFKKIVSRFQIYLQRLDHELNKLLKHFITRISFGSKKYFATFPKHFSLCSFVEQNT